jgi:hypothetical protein
VASADANSADANSADGQLPDESLVELQRERRNTRRVVTLKSESPCSLTQISEHAWLHQNVPNLVGNS